MNANARTNKTNKKTNNTGKNASSNTRKASTSALIVTDRQSLNSCWLRTGDSYELIGKAGRTCNRTLPRTPARNEHVLKENGIPYRMVTVPNRYDANKEYHMCEYWSPDLYEEETMRRTVFEDISDKGSETRIFQKAGMYEEVLPTYDTVRAAIAMREFVSAKIAESEYNKYYEIAQAALEGCDAGYGVGYLDRDVELEAENGNIMILQAHKFKDDKIEKKIRYYGVFDKSHLNSESVVTLYVPEEIAGSIIGKGAKNRKDWEEKLGVKYIKVEAVKTVKETEAAQA